MQNTKLKIEWFKNPYTLNEISQQTGMIFAFLSAPRDGSKQIHPWAKCRDFLHDAVKCALTKTTCLIYGFKYDGGNDAKLDLRRMRIMVSKLGLKDDEGEPNFNRKMKASRKLLNHYEQMAGVGFTKVKKVYDGRRPVWIFNGPSFWLKAPALVSMYTFLIRLGDKELEFTDNESLLKAYKNLLATYKKADNDVTYLKTMRGKLHKVIQNNKELFFMESAVDPLYLDDTITISNFHNNGGIWSFCNLNLPQHTKKVERVKATAKLLK